MLRWLGIQVDSPNARASLETTVCCVAVQSQQSVGEGETEFSVTIGCPLLVATGVPEGGPQRMWVAHLFRRRALVSTTEAGNGNLATCGGGLGLANQRYRHKRFT